MHWQLLFLALVGTSLASPVPANNVAEKVTYSASGASDVIGNGFGCAHITPAGQSSQLGCVKHVFTDGFTVGVTDDSTKQAILCSIAGTSGACGPAGVNIAVDLAGGTGTAPPPSGAAGTTTLTAAELSNKPI